MSIKTRRFIFYSFTLLFLLASVLIIQNSRGFNFDFASFSFNETGGIYISSIPTDAEILLNDAAVKNQSGLLQRGTLITNLVPDVHELLVTREGYRKWKKNPVVLPETVTTFDSVVLVPDISPELFIDQVVSDFSILGDEQIIFQNNNGVWINDEQVLGHRIVDNKRNGIALTKSITTDNYYLVNAFTLQNQLNVTLVFNNLKESVLDLPGEVDLSKAALIGDGREMILSTERAIYYLDTDDLGIDLITSDTNEFSIQEDDLVTYINNEGTVMVYDPKTNNSTTLKFSEETSEFGSYKKIRLSATGTFLLTDNNELYLYSTNLEKIAEDIVDFYLSPGGEQIAMIRGNSSISIYRKKRNETKIIDIGSFEGNFSQLEWYRDYAHLLVRTDNKLYFWEIDKEAPISKELISEDARTFHYDGDADLIYIATSKNLSTFDMSPSL
ncbi:MAG: hypothetical protein COT88_01410 [Candidatus Colwellbacteria bacterium CG10_big_fil_rev_8_21_14_0_10_41_28]|uniref:PEGA domain-containing protein n=1 Tax=Candidatus Colwellbacteria bacterium CG10_big_fil_rev_8_21_14_0_10_41_28 TaxID=1974539 RepID=A0A2H0VH79_9BACT|nr:MAG: hypothetical protein COT88_01410 [Candidatus Colwellbacteria bacterium CG10_big_fil_rev_8_21_14_0_10_41_28]